MYKHMKSQMNESERKFDNGNAHQLAKTRNVSIYS